MGILVFVLLSVIGVLGWVLFALTKRPASSPGVASGVHGSLPTISPSPGALTHEPWMEHPLAKELTQAHPYWPMVHVYAGAGLLEPLRLCVEASGQPDTQEKVFGYTPLHIAAIFDRYECARWLIEQGASTEISDQEGCTPVYVAARHGSDSVVDLLVGKGARAGVANARGDTPLHEASIKGSEELVGILLRGGGDMERRDELGRTPLFIAADKGNVGAAKTLVKAGANIGAEDDWGNTPLLQAVMGRHFELARYLAQRGGDPYHKSGGGNSPFDMAIYLDHPNLFDGIYNPRKD